MSAFSYPQMPSFLLDSILLQSSDAKNMGDGFWDEGLPTLNTFPTSFPLQNCPISDPKMGFNRENRDVSVMKNQSGTDQSSTVVDKHEIDVKFPPGKKKRNGGGASRERKTKKMKKPVEEIQEESKPSPVKKSQKKPPEEPPTGYIHVRARRGQATDSHSLAERVRREKISERMKILQRLVPGCDKVSGKALVLDEIINYVQSLQNQVEFLSMKLSTVNPLFYEYGVDLDDVLVKQECLSNMDSTMNPAIHSSVFIDSTTGSATAAAPATGSSCSSLQGQRWVDISQKLMNPVWFEEFFHPK